jgi:RNA polymerase sigma factor (sigma-70 family)
MAAAQLGTVLRHVRKLVVSEHTRERSDAQLLQCFAAGGEEDAFAALVERHGPLVWGVCRRVLRNHHDAEDAFQATFLVLARNAAAIRKAEALPSWLHGAAYRIALRARRDAAIRRAHERRGQTMPAEKSLPETALREALTLLDEEIQRLPPKQRAAFVLCSLEGKSQAEAARQLGANEGTVSVAVSRARKRLAQQLARRGVTLSAALAAVALGRSAASAAVPLLLTHSTIRAALLYAAGKPAAAAGLCAAAAALAEGATRTMFLSKAKIATVVLLLAILLTGAGVLTHQALAAKQTADEPPAKAAVPPPAPPAREGKESEGTVVLSGRVLDPDGKPLADAQLFLWTKAFKDKKDVAVKTTTSDDGRFRLTVSRADLERNAKLVATAKDYGPDWLDSSEIAKGGEVTLRLVKDDVPINGRILDLEGQPVAGASLSVIRVEQGDLKHFLEAKKRGPFPDGMKALSAAALGEPTTLTTGKDGRIHLTGFGRDRVVLFTLKAPGLENSTFHVLTRTEPLPGMRGGESFGTYVAHFEHTSLPSKPIIGTVRDKGTGKPVAGVTVASVMYEKVYTQTDAQGHYRIDGVGKRQKYAVAAGGNSYFNATKFDIPDTQGVEPLTVDFELERGIVVRGRLTDKATGKPVAGHVGWLALPDNPNLKNTTGSAGPQFIVKDEGWTKADDGSFAVLAIPGPGLLKVKAADENRYPAARTEGVKTASGIILQEYHALVPIDPSENDPKSLTRDIVLEPAPSLAGTVTDPDGQPLEGARTAGLPPIPQLFRDIPKMNAASFTVGGVRPGEPRALFFLHPEKKLARLARLRGDEKGPLTIRLEPLGALSGRVVDADGRPWAGLKVSARYNIGAIEAARLAAKDFFDLPWDLLYQYPAWDKLINREATTAADGRFRIDDLVPGLEYDLAAKAGEGEGGVPVVTRVQLAVESGKAKDVGDLKSKEAPGK